MIIKQHNIDLEQECAAEFRSYVAASGHNTNNSQVSHTFSGKFLGASNYIQKSFNVLDLHTERVIWQNTIRVIPITKQVINMLEAMAHHQPTSIVQVECRINFGWWFVCRSGGPSQNLGRRIQTPTKSRWSQLESGGCHPDAQCIWVVLQYQQSKSVCNITSISPNETTPVRLLDYKAKNTIHCAEIWFWTSRGRKVNGTWNIQSTVGNTFCLGFLFPMGTGKHCKRTCELVEICKIEASSHNNTHLFSPWPTFQ